MALILDKVRRLFLKRPQIMAVFTDETGNEYRRRFKYENNQFRYKPWGKKETYYIVKHSHCLIDRRWGIPLAHYWEGDPNPRWMRHEKPSAVDSIGLTQIMDSKIVEDLFKDEQADKMMWVLILCGVAVVLLIVVLLIQFGVIHVGAAVPK